jgi:hypothetical protein
VPVPEQHLYFSDVHIGVTQQRGRGRAQRRLVQAHFAVE